MNAARAFLLTPQGRSAVATIAVIGEAACTLVEPLFHSASGRRLVALAPNAVAFGHWREPAGEELVVARTDRGLEIHCHGGVAASRAILADLVRAGVEVAAAAAWFEATLPGHLEREAAELLPAAATMLVADHLLAQMQGSLRREVESLVAAFGAGRVDEGRSRAERLLRDARFGLRLTDPWRVVLCGPPNVGKSSLINRLLGYSRAVVYDRPGTTRDVLTACGALRGWPIEWTDTAGIRKEPGTVIESEGIARARAALQNADLILWVRDVTEEARVGEEAGLSETRIAAEPDHKSAQVPLANKIDLRPQATLRDGEIAVSASTGQGIPQLMEVVAERLLGASPPDPGAPLPLLPRHVEALQRCRAADDPSDAANEAASLL